MRRLLGDDRYWRLVDVLEPVAEGITAVLIFALPALALWLAGRV